MGLDFEFVCALYLQDLQENVSLGASVLESAIEMSLGFLDSKLMSMENLAPVYSMTQMYTSLCVLENQQWIPAAVPAKMWAVDDTSAQCIAVLFSSMCLSKTSVQNNLEGRKEVGLSVHDLNSHFCVEKAQRESGSKAWHFRLLKGHMPSLPSLGHELIGNVTSFQGILEHSSQAWYVKDLKNKTYMRHNVARHLLEAGLLRELWALVLNPKWMHAQCNAGNISSIKSDLGFFKTCGGGALNKRRIGL